MNFGRFMKTALLEDGARERVVSAVLALTRSRPLIVNLEGVILPNVPAAIDDMTLAMPEELAIDMLRALGVVAVGLANNHAMDLGASGYAETKRALAAAGLPSFGQGETLALPGLDVTGLTDIDTNGSQQTDLVTDALLDRLVRADASRTSSPSCTGDGSMSPHPRRANRRWRTRCGCAPSGWWSAPTRM